MLSGSSATAAFISSNPFRHRAPPLRMSPAWNAQPACVRTPPPCQTIASACFGFFASVSSHNFIALSNRALSPASPAKTSSRTRKSKRFEESGAEVAVEKARCEIVMTAAKTEIEASLINLRMEEKLLSIGSSDYESPLAIRFSDSRPHHQSGERTG